MWYKKKPKEVETKRTKIAAAIGNTYKITINYIQHYTSIVFKINSKKHQITFNKKTFSAY